MQLSDEDIVMIGDSLQHMCKDLAGGLFARPEQTCEPTAFAQALDLFVDQGFVSVDDEPACGLWDGCDDPANLALTLQSLSTLGAVNAALALSVHRSALSHHLLRQLRVKDKHDAHITLCLHGSHGIGRGELANWWCGQAVDAAVLNDVFDPDRVCHTLIHSKTNRLLVPVFTNDTLAWRLTHGAADGSRAGHGLDELHDGAFHAVQARVIQAPVGQDKALSRDIWHREWLGLLAIQSGCVRKMVDMATQYSALRYQGGSLIAAHPAVQIMRTDMLAALADVRTTLAAQRLSDQGFADMLLARVRLQDGLNLAANAAMQTFGGVGYMRDTGIEKRWRDTNQLRHQSGGALDMQLMAATWGVTA